MTPKMTPEMEKYVKIDTAISLAGDSIDKFNQIMRMTTSPDEGLAATLAFIRKAVLEPIEALTKEFGNDKLLKIPCEYVQEVSSYMLNLKPSLDSIYTTRDLIVKSSKNHATQFRIKVMEQCNSTGAINNIRNMSEPEKSINKDKIKLCLLQAIMDLIETNPDISGVNWNSVIEGSVQVFNATAGSDLIEKNWVTFIANKLNEQKDIESAKMLVTRLMTDIKNKEAVRTVDDVVRLRSFVESIKHIIDYEDEKSPLLCAMIMMGVDKHLLPMNIIDEIAGICNPIREEKPFDPEEIKAQLDDIVEKYKPSEKEMIKNTHLEAIKNGEMRIVIEEEDE